ncbi:transmembrane protein 6/97 [Sordaria brevicollis]|uniref:Transmembrane protein 6/97 n=1 Tax=Sordaria brevicollis TaxID=83679 RepID=A0AAE0UCB7_SORBR|nr:transmembrane protein 6/97 [Sordaria brevicollis]
MAIYNTSRLNYLWAAWFGLSIPVILLIDALPHYPSHLYLQPSSPLHPFHLLRQQYLLETNDPISQWSFSSSIPGSHDSWIGLFMYFEFFFSLPVVLYGFYRLALARGTTGPQELLYLLYALETAFTTLICIHDVFYWDPAVYSPEIKRKMVVQYLGPWVLVPSIMAIDMARRILGRIKLADEVMEEREREEKERTQRRKVQ